MRPARSPEMRRRSEARGRTLDRYLSPTDAARTAIGANRARSSRNGTYRPDPRYHRHRGEVGHTAMVSE